MKILVYSEEWNGRSRGGVSLSSATSVETLKHHFFETLEKLGKVSPIDDSYHSSLISQRAGEPGTIFASFQQTPPDEVACRLLYHSRGALMLPGGFLASRTFHPSSCNLVTTQLQKDQLGRGLGASAPNTAVFTPRLETSVFYPKEATLKPEYVAPVSEHVRFVYAGRWIANKGICQVIRALNLWPMAGAQFRLIGDFEPEFPIQLSNANHTTFPSFFQRECLHNNFSINITLEGSMDPIALRDAFWGCDVFLYPSFHEDENFGIAPREAALCGLPIVATDFCGLGQIRRGTGQGCIKTYPTLSGVRYSLRELRELMQAAAVAARSMTRQTDAAERHQAIAAECDPGQQTANLREACEKLVALEPTAVDLPSWRCQERFGAWLATAPTNFQRAAAIYDSDKNHGFLPDGLGFSSDGWFSDVHFFEAIQSLYTTLRQPPTVKSSMVLRGFWRLRLWVEEKCLIEFGFPGPRRFFLSDAELACLMRCVSSLKENDLFFVAKGEDSLATLQKLVAAGFLVPDHF